MAQTLGNRIKKFREQKGLSQSRLARTADISNDYMNRIEGDKVKNIGLEKINAIAEVLEVNPVKLLYEEEDYSISEAPDFTPFDIPVFPLAKISVKDSFDKSGFLKAKSNRKIHRPEDIKDPQAYGIEVDTDALEPLIRKKTIVVVSPQQKVKNGDYVVVSLDKKKIDLRSYYDNGRSITLTSTNFKYPPLTLSKKDLFLIHPIVWIKLK